MKVFATQEFIVEYQKLIRKNSYKYLTATLIDTYFDKPIKDCLQGTQLNGHSVNPFIKKRLGGSGGLRIYLFIVVANENLYFSFVHPKSGTLGYENISNQKKTSLLNDLLQNIKSNDLIFEVKKDPISDTLIFVKT